MADRIDKRAFAEMEYATADKTAVDLLGDKAEVTSEDVHNMLMAAGFTPGLGNIADVADAILYAAEGEFGAAGLSAAAIIPFIGQTVSAKRALKIAKESGEKMRTLYRGVDRWHPGEMVKDRKFVGGGGYLETLRGTTSKITGKDIETAGDVLWTTTNKEVAEGFGRRGRLPMAPEPRVLEFEVPESFIKKYSHVNRGSSPDDIQLIFEQGLPKEFLTKVHK